MARHIPLAEAAASLSQHFHNVGKDSSSEGEDNIIVASKRLMKHLAAPLVSQMKLDGRQSSGIRLLDSACGAGVFTQEVQKALRRDVLDKSTFVCTDSSHGMVELVRKRVGGEGWVNVETRVADATDSGLAADSFTHVAVALGLHLIPDPDAVLADCQRILKQGGVFGATTFPRSNGRRFWFPDMREAFASFSFPGALLPDEMPMQMHDSGRWDDAAWIQTHLAAKGFEEVLVVVSEGSCRVEGADEWMRLFGMMMPFLMRTWWSEETRRAHDLDEVKKLVSRFLKNKYGDEGWEVSWEIISMTGVVHAKKYKQ
ncbi:hypothetical protein DCS_02506 [Drechmeria coniospora]|uniref:Methyltransferase type 11 domain-containing protein n=1 Tax=Drechmeria coniospora TaxID=98403 RepID=A0A151GW88_DRECN|nr:hypothetical protein DCS_02506 [Drechmeria coniospora]KYK61364.1 hypothetical protein DCS_02506 [Drechmeria coniospora]ODA81127.1 hypothetical protein RJ55_04090 [Drechmeria coniospora]